MSKTTLPELRKMSLADLVKEARSLRDDIAKMRMHVRLLSQKDTARYSRLRKQLARMETVLTEKRAEQLSNVSSTSKVSAPTSAESPATS